MKQGFLGRKKNEAERTTPTGLQKVALDSATDLVNVQMGQIKAALEAVALTVRDDMGLSDEYVYNPEVGRFVLRETLAPTMIPVEAPPDPE